MKKGVVLGLGLILSIGLSFVSYAGEWKQDTNGQWWQNDDGTYPKSSWQWIDGNQDGIAECYYFDENGYMMSDTTTPDKYQVNADGAWVVDGVVQSQSSTTETLSKSYGGYSINPILLEEMTVPLQKIVDKYGSIKDMNSGSPMLYSNYENAEHLSLNSPTFDEYYGYVYLRPAHSEYNAAYDLNHDGIVNYDDELIAWNNELANKEMAKDGLYSKICEYLNDYYYFSLDRPLCEIITKGKVLIGPEESITVEEAGRLVTGMGATDVKVTNQNKREQIYTSSADVLFVPTGEWITVNTTRLKFALNGLLFSVTGTKGLITPENTWLINQAAEPAK